METRTTTLVRRARGLAGPAASLLVLALASHTTHSERDGHAEGCGRRGSGRPAGVRALAGRPAGRFRRRGQRFDGVRGELGGLVLDRSLGWLAGGGCGVALPMVGSARLR